MMFSPLRPSVRTAELLGRLTLIEGDIAHEFSRRLHEFHIAIRDDGLVLEGRTASYYSKQLAQEAVSRVIALPIVANHICVDYQRCELPTDGQ